MTRYHEISVRSASDVASTTRVSAWKDAAMSNPDEGRSRAAVIGDGIEWVSRWSFRWVGIALGAALLGLIVKFAWRIILPVALALVITSVLAPIAGFFERRLRFPAALSAAAALLTAIGAIVGTAFALAPSIGGQTSDIASDTLKGIERVQKWVQESDIVSKAQIDTALQAIQDRLASSSGDIANGVLVATGAVTSAVITLIVSLILTFLFLDRKSTRLNSSH